MVLRCLNRLWLGTLVTAIKLFYIGMLSQFSVEIDIAVFHLSYNVLNLGSLLFHLLLPSVEISLSLVEVSFSLTSLFSDPLHCSFVQQPLFL